MCLEWGQLSEGLEGVECKSILVFGDITFNIMGFCCPKHERTTASTRVDPPQLNLTIQSRFKRDSEASESIMANVG